MKLYGFDLYFTERKGAGKASKSRKSAIGAKLATAEQGVDEMHPETSPLIADLPLEIIGPVSGWD